MNPRKDLKEQEAFEGSSLSKEDEKLYELLLQELENAPELEIKPAFSQAVAQKLAKRKKRESRSEAFLFGFAIVGVLLIAVMAGLFAKQATQNGPDFLKEGPLAPALAFTGLLILFQFIDKKYLRDHRLRRKLNNPS